MGLIKKIFQSLDFQNNRIFNAKIGDHDNITEDEHIVDKKYVDDSITYSTETSQEKEDSTTIERMKQNDGKKYNELFDTLLYGDINPLYHEPDIKVVNVRSETTFDNYFYQELNNNIYVKIETKYNDRSFVSNPTLQINGLSCDIVSNIDNNIWEFKIENITNINNLQNIVFTQNFGPYTGAIKKNNNNVDYIDPEFENQKTITKNLTNDIKNSIEIRYPILISPRRNSSSTPTYDDYQNFTRFSFMFSDSNNEEIRDLLIPEYKVDKNIKVLQLSNNSDCSPAISYIQCQNSETITINNIRYVKSRFNFGYCSSDSEGINGIGLY